MSEWDRLVDSPTPDAAAVFVMAKWLGPIVTSGGSVVANGATGSSDAVESALRLPSFGGAGAAAREGADADVGGAPAAIANGDAPAGVWK